MSNKLKINEEFKDLIFPLTDEEYDGLEKNIIENGCLDAIKTWDNGTIIDGHHRYKICTKHNIEYDVCEMDFDTKNDVMMWIILNQFDRRNLNLYQRSVLALKCKDIIAAVAKEKQGTRTDIPQISVKSSDPIDTQKVLAKMASVSHDTIYKTDVIQKKATDEDKEKLRSGEVSVNSVYNDIKQQEKRDNKNIEVEELKKREVLPIVDTYDVIVIDPPWDMKKIERDVAPNQVEFDYPTMSIDEIKNFKLPAEPNCHVFLWITHKYLPYGFDILKEWLIKYVCCFVWHKNGGFQPFGLPQYNCEFILYARIGTPSFVDLKQFPTCFNANRTGHSKKPNEFYDIIRRVTTGKRIDIFNRREIKGFDRWGNEA